MWYRDWFRDSNYLTVYQHRDTGEAEQMLDLIERVVDSSQMDRVLDLGCGSGRHSISFAKRGYNEVTGVDLSPTLLSVARENAEREDAKIDFIEADMRTISRRDHYDLIVNLFTSFGYFERDEENADVIAGIARALKPGGWFVQDFFNEYWLRKHLVAHDERMMPDGRRLEQTRWIEGGRVEKRLLLRSQEEAIEYIESVRMFGLADFERMYASAGLRLQHLFGSYDGSTFDLESSPRLIMFSTKP